MPRADARGLPDLWHFASEYLLLLPFGALVGLVWANSPPESYFRTVFALDFFVTDVAMVLVFGLVTKEIVEATAPGGVLHPWRRAALPLVAGLGSALLSAVLVEDVRAARRRADGRARLGGDVRPSTSRSVTSWQWSSFAAIPQCRSFF